MPYALSIAVILILGIFTWIYKRLAFHKIEMDLAWEKLIYTVSGNPLISASPEENKVSLSEIKSERFNSNEITFCKSDIQNEGVLLLIEEYNSRVDRYNCMVTQFPGNILAPLGAHQSRAKIIFRD
jgi:hypothetical protein